MTDFLLLAHALLLKPNSVNEDSRRREFILNILLLGSLILSGCALIEVGVHIIMAGSSAYRGSSQIAVAIAFIFFLLLYVLSRNYFFSLASYLLITLYFSLGIFATYTWAGLLPQGPLIYALVIVMASILISTRVSLVMTGLTGVAVLSLYYARTSHLLTHSIHIPTQDLFDVIINVVILSIIALVSWLSNREIERSLIRARDSENQLKEERDLLEVKVAERTQELKQAQIEQMAQLYRFAEFGRLSSGLVHDLLSPLTTVSLSLKEYSASNNTTLLQKAVQSTKKIESFIESARKQIRNETHLSTFSLESEIKQVLFFLHHKASRGKVELCLESKTDSHFYGNPVKFSQVLSNLVSNAIDSYEGCPLPKEPAVLIRLEKQAKGFQLSVTDHGKGMTPAVLDKIFDPFFSTKSLENGSGIGLSIAKDIIEKDFQGRITVTTSSGKGSSFMVSLPYKK